MRAYMNNSRTSGVHCSAYTPLRLVKVIITDHEYFSILAGSGGLNYNDMPELGFHNNQFRDLHFAAPTELYVKSQVDEVLTTLVSPCR